MRELEGKIAVITGASSGIGLATPQRFVAEGALRFLSPAAVKANLTQQRSRSATLASAAGKAAQDERVR